MAGQVSEQIDTLLRAFYLCNNPAFDALLAEVSDSWQEELKRSFEAEELAASEGADASSNASGSSRKRKEKLEDVLALAQSLLPPPPAGATTRLRAEPLHWPVPSLNLSNFEQHIATQPFSLYGCTRHLFMHTRAGYVLARQSKPSFAVLVPHLATVVTRALVDGYWSYFYATGDPVAISKVLDVGTPYTAFVEEYGDAPVVHYKPLPRGADGSGSSDDPVFRDWAADFEDDPYSLMRFDTSRYALWTLVMNAATHTHVGESFLRQADQLHDHVALLDPVTRLETMTAFGEQRLQLIKLLAPAVHEMHQRALMDGIGSGQWPASYDAGRLAALSGEGLGSAARLLSDGTGDSALHGAPAEQSQDVGAALAALLKSGGAGADRQGGEGGSAWGGESVKAGSAESGGESRVAAAKRLLGQQRHLDRRQPPDSIRKFLGTR